MEGLRGLTLPGLGRSSVTAGLHFGIVLGEQAMCDRRWPILRSPMPSYPPPVLLRSCRLHKKFPNEYQICARKPAVLLPGHEYRPIFLVFSWLFSALNYSAIYFVGVKRQTSEHHVNEGTPQCAAVASTPHPSLQPVRQLSCS